MKKLYSLSIALLCAGFAAQAEEPVVTTFNAVADTWIRTDNGGNKNGSKTTVELRTNSTDDPDVFNKFFALYGFKFQLPDGMKVQSATLKLVTERVKSGPVSVHGYNHDFTEGDACWDAEKSYIEPLIVAEPLTSFNVAGQDPKAIWDGGLKEDKQNVDAWTNTIDVTAYVKKLTVNDTRANFLLHLPLDIKCDQVCFFTRENTGQDLTEKYGYTITPEELMPQLTVSFVEDADTSNDVILPSDDTWVRSDNNNKYGSTSNMEIRYVLNDDNTRGQQFYGLMSFTLPVDVTSGTHEVTSARLRLVQDMVKGDRNMEIYAYPSKVDEANATWKTESDKVAETLATEPIATYVANGQGNKAMWDGGVTEQYLNAEAWTNYIDLTEYIKAHPQDLNILITKRDATPNNSIRIATKENVGNTNGSVEFKADDLKPLLYITYTKKDNGQSSGIGEIEVAEENAPVEYYNLQGVRVENPANGLYIKRQGSKVEKIIIR